MRAIRQCGTRRATWVVAVVVALLVGGGAHAEVLTVATYNVENYGAADRMTEAGYRKQYPKPETEKRALRSVIRALGADILVLQEIGGPAYLEELQHDLAAEGCDYPHQALATGPDAERHVAVLSRRPLGRVMTLDLTFPYFGSPEHVKRGVLHVVVPADGGDVTLFAVHLKSRFTERPDDIHCDLRRTGEATAIRDAVLRRFPEPRTARFLVLGDCNDSPASKPLERLQHRGTTLIAALLPVRDANDETWTYFYRKEDTYSRVDHILVSPALLPTVEGGRATIYAGPGVREASDHRPVVVRLNVSSAGIRAGDGAPSTD